MNVLIQSRMFLPRVGGLERMMHMIAVELARAGHAVTVITETPAKAEEHQPYRVLRQPTLLDTVRAAMRSEVCLIANITLRFTPLMLLLGRKVVTSHQGWYHGGQNPMLRASLKNFLSYLTYNIFCSKRVGQNIPGPGIVIPNAYSQENFFAREGVVKDRDIVFLGRLVSDKGCDVLLHALHELRERKVDAGLTIVGDGPELPSLKAQADDLKLSERVDFAGILEGKELAHALSRHRVLAVPSIWEEPFGIVALEGAACGCVAVGTDGGGLPEAIGPCGLVVKRGDAFALADGLERALTDQAFYDACRSAAPAHLARHTQRAVGARYARALEAIASGRSLDSLTPASQAL